MSLNVIIEETLYLSQTQFSDFPKAEVKFQKPPRKPHNFVKQQYLSPFFTQNVRFVPGTERTFLSCHPEMH